MLAPVAQNAEYAFDEQSFDWRRGHAVLWWFLAAAGREKLSLRRQDVHMLFLQGEREANRLGIVLCGRLGELSEAERLRFRHVERLLRSEFGMADVIEPLPVEKLSRLAFAPWFDGVLTEVQRECLGKVWHAFVGRMNETFSDSCPLTKK